MTVHDFLTAATKTLEQAGIESARLDTLILLEDELGENRAHILAHPSRELAKETGVELNKKIARRSTHLPLAYIRGTAPFYGRNFIVSEHVLVPRPETEALIALLKTLALPKQPVIADIGTGSGCLGITAALELPDSLVTLSDNDPEALRVARANVALLAPQVTVKQVDLLADLPPKTDVVVANLPYVPEALPINQAAAHEPKNAIFAGADGLDLYKQLWHQLSGLKAKPRFICIEALPAQHHTLAMLARAAGYYLKGTSGFAQAYERL
ncbi:MAG TPA: HemK/PrmC family methyltransferase [Candidatus Saccharimonadales bacterium]|nr:HemK/PrmC family methyltransferase [Candidatus Saccharimonadales bacterium]